MRYRVFLAALLFASFTVSAQDKDKGIAVSVGLHQTNSTGLFRPGFSDEAVLPSKQTPLIFFDANVIFKKHGCPGFRLRPVYGFGVNQKGFTQTGLASDGTANMYAYSHTFKRTYVSLYAGASYYFIYKKKVKMDAGFLLNPDLDVLRIVQNDSYFRPVALGSRSFVAVDVRLNQKMGLRLSPYFQYSLGNYYPRLKNGRHTDYRPYGFGMNVGLVF